MSAPGLRLRVLVVALVMSLNGSAAQAVDGPVAQPVDAKIVGWLESIVIPDAKLRVVAKLDTGAKTSALDAEDLQWFDRNGERWVRFGIRTRHSKGPAHVLEARVVGTKKIRSAVGRDERPLVDLWVCIAGERRRILFSLGHREGMNYRVILGRRALEGRLVVDSARKFTTLPGCSLKE